MASPASGKLRVGLLLDSLHLTAWERAMLERVRDSGDAEIVLLVLNDRPASDKSLATRLRNFRSHGLYLLYQRLEARLFRPQPDAFARVDASDLLGAIPSLSVRPRETQFSDRFPDADVDAIAQHEIDVIVRLGFRILRGRILQAARYGVWSLHHGDNQRNRGGPAGFWEVLENQATTGSMLQILDEDLDNGLILYDSQSATEELSVNRNKNRFFWKSVAFLPRMLRELRRLGPDAFLDRAQRARPALNFYSARLYTTPGNLEFLQVFARHLLRRVRFKLYKLFFVDQWFLLFDQRKSISSSPWRYNKIVPPKDRFWADPHVMHRDDRYYVFLEEYLYASRKGHISVLTLDSKGHWSAPRRVLERPYHLSYPFVFSWQGNDYMVPETAKNGRIEIYRCERFPDQWTYHGVLMDDVQATDATLFEHAGRWWMFVNVAEHAGSSTWDELFLFHAETPLGSTWVPHPKNPIVSDVRRSRPAGALFEDDGRLFRPSQDCSQAYGYGIRINEITKWTDTEYEEREVSFIEPLWDSRLRGTHTFCYKQGLTMIDAKQRRSRFF